MGSPSRSGAFQEAPDQRVEQFTESVSFDHRLYSHDIVGSIAHAQMLASVKLISDDERDQIVAALREIEHQLDSGQFELRTELEDIHMHIEQALIERLGDVGRKLHTGRSRNDQVSTDLRLWIRDEMSYDQFHDYSDRLYRVMENVRFSDGQVMTQFSAPGLLGEVIKADVPEVVYSSTMDTWTNTVISTHAANLGGKIGAYVADSFLYLFGYIAYALSFVSAYYSWLMLREPPTAQVLTPKRMLLVRIGGLVLTFIASCGLFSLYVETNVTYMPRAEHYLGEVTN